MFKALTSAARMRLPITDEVFHWKYERWTLAPLQPVQPVQVPTLATPSEPPCQYGWFG